MISKRYLAVILLFGCFSMVSASEPIKLLDRTGGAVRLQKLLSGIWQNKSLNVPDDWEFDIKKISVEPEKTELANSLIIEESFAPAVDEKLFVCADYALVPVVVAVPLSCPLDNLNISELKAIYAGRMTSWQNSAAGKVLRIAGPPERSAHSRVFRALVMNQNLYSHEPVAPGNDILPDMIVCSAGGAAGLLEVLDNIIVFGSQELINNCRGKYKLLKINGIAPDKENILSRRYPLVAAHRVRYCRNTPVLYAGRIVELLRYAAGRDPGMIAAGR